MMMVFRCCFLPTHLVKKKVPFVPIFFLRCQYSQYRSHKSSQVEFDGSVLVPSVRNSTVQKKTIDSKVGGEWVVEKRRAKPQPIY